MNIDYNPGEALENPFGESYFKAVSGSLFESSAAVTVFDRYYQQTFNKEDTLYVIGGTDSGLLPFYLAEKFEKDRGGRKFVFIDYQKIFDNIDISGLPDWIDVYPADFPMGVLSQAEVEYMASGKIMLIRTLSIIDAAAGSDYEALWLHIDDDFRKLMFAENVTSVTRSFVDAQLMNYHRNIRPIKSLRGKLKGHDVLLLGGGPSLDQSIEWIKANSDHLIIMAAARISNRLLQEGIVPDFLVSVDPHDLSFDNSKHMLQFDGQTVLMNCHHINPKLLNQWALNSVYFGESLPWGQSEENSSSPGPTVIHSALHQAVFMGAENVYLTGVDLCFYKGQTHASGSAESQIGKLSVKHLTQVETYSGEMAETDQAFASGVENLAWLVQGYQEHAKNCSVFNLSEHAAKVEGVEYKEIAEVELPQQFDKHELMAEINEILSVNLKSLLQHQKQALKAFQKKRQQLRQAIEIAEKGSQLIDKEDSTENHSSRLIKFQSKLDKKLGDMGEMLYHYGIDYFRTVFKPVEDEDNMSDDEIRSTLQGYFQGMIKASNDLIERLDQSIAILKRRIVEYDENSRPSELLVDWLNYFEPGRSRIWQGLHPQVTLSEEDEAAIKQCETQLQRNIQQADTKQAQLLKQRSESPVELYKKAMPAYDKQDIDTLQDIEKQLEKLKGFEADQLQCLVQGMLDDLSGNSGPADAAFAKIQFKPFQLFALKRRLHFAMQAHQHEQVLLFLEQLCGFSLEYMLTYANYLQLLGQNELALAVLQSFTQQMPEHFVGWLSLAELAIKQQQMELALAALEQAKTLQPDNPQLSLLLEQLSS